MLESNYALDLPFEKNAKVFRPGRWTLTLSILIAVCSVIATTTTRFPEAKMIFLGLGLLSEISIALFFRNVRLILDSRGATYFDWLGRVAFEKPWSAVDRMGFLAEHSDGRGRQLALVAGASQCELDSFKEIDEIAQIVQERAPHAVVAPSLLHQPPIQQGKTK